MSTLKTNTIQHLTSGFNNVVAHTDGAGTANAVHARAWVFFNGTGTVAINAQFNVSSITDNGQGAYTVNLTNALSSSNYAVAGSTGDPTGGSSGVWFTTGHNTNSFNASQTTTSFRVQLYYTTSLVADVPHIGAVVFQ